MPRRGPLHDDREHGLSYRVGAIMWLTAVIAVPFSFLLPHPYPVSASLVLSGAALGIAMSAFCWRAATSPRPSR